MFNALFAFDDRAVGRQAAERLVQAGLAEPAVELHEHPHGPGQAAAAYADELATGGFLTNFRQLFQGLFEWGGSPHDRSVYEDTLRRGGAVVSVDVADEAQRDLANRVMADAVPSHSTGWVPKR